MDEERERPSELAFEGGTDEPSEARDESWTLHDILGWPPRVARSLLGATMSAGIASLIDTLVAVRAETNAAPTGALSQIFLHSWGLSAPLLLLTACAGSVMALVVHPGAPPSARTALATLRRMPSRQRISWSLLLPLGLLGAFGWLVAMGHAARWILATVPSARGAGLLIGGAAATAGMIATALVLMLFAGAHAAMIHRRKSFRQRFHPLWTVVVGLAVCIALFACGVHTGTTGGEGGVLGIFGVFKRIELDLRPAWLLVLVAATAYASAGVLGRVHPMVAVLVAILPLALTVRSAVRLQDSPRVTSLLERQAVLARPSLRFLRRVTDRDRDGASGWFGGGDCDDRNPLLHPLAIDVPRNGIDEDCSGSDARPAEPVPPAATAVAAGREGIAKNLNVIFLSVDTLRWDTGFMGYPRPITPSLDRLAQRSVVFERAYTLASYTGKVIGPIMVGKYPSETHMGWAHYNRFPPEDIMVQERLQQAGIRTISVQSHWYFKPSTGLGRGFDVLDMSAAPAQGIDATTDTTWSADRLTDAAISVLGKPENTDRRFFAWVHYFDPHAEYMRHKDTPTFGNRVRDMYDHEVRWTDDQIGRLLEFVEQQPWSATTVIVVTSDHGESFGEHNMWRHGFELWEPLVRVPLVILVPNVAPRRVQVRRSLIDLVPTFLDLFGVENGTPRHDSDFVSGRSLVPDLLATDDQSVEPRAVFIDMPAGPYNESRRAFIAGDRKLIVSGGVRYQLFDLATDPDEARDLADDGALLRAARESYDAFCAGLRQVPVRPPSER